jgi:hypothetical protein
MANRVLAGEKIISQPVDSGVSNTVLIRTISLIGFVVTDCRYIGAGASSHSHHVARRARSMYILWQ